MKHDTTKPSHPDECNILKRAPDTETIDRLFLELSQFSNARTGREMELRKQIDILKSKLEEATLKSSFSIGWEKGTEDAERWSRGSVQRAVDHASHLEKVIAELKAERKDNEEEISCLKAQLKNASLQRDEAGAEARRKREDHEGACKLVAEMHAAAMGKICGPARGVVEDVEDLRKERDALKAEYEMRAAWIKRMVKILGCENEDGRNCRDPHLVAETIIESNAKLLEELQSLKANNRYQLGHTHGFTEALAKVQEQVLKMRV